MESLSIQDFPSVQSPAPSYHSNISESEQVPLWAREVAASLQRRQRLSRASSIVSTRTKTSTSTARGDARSIDLNLDGVHFRISRDGSRITTSDLQGRLLPYIPYHEAVNGDVGSSEDEQGHDLRDDESVSTEVAHPQPERNPPPLPPGSQFSSHGNTAEHPFASQGSRLGPTADIALSRNPSFTPGKEQISVTKRRAVSQDDMPRYAAIRRKPLDANSHLRRRNGIRLPTLITNLSDDQRPESGRGLRSALDSGYPAWRHARSADPTLGNDDHSFSQEPASPMFIGREAPGLFPTPPTDPSGTRHVTSGEDDVTIHAPSAGRLEEGYADTDPPPPMESENDISVHYIRLIRTIDRDHRKVLHERDKEMAKLRERLNDQDTIYRQQLRARDFTIDDLKSRLAHLETSTDDLKSQLAHLETSTEAIVERARNSVEDMWESRWKGQHFHLTERMRRMETESLVAVERAIAERDKVWAKAWATKYKELIQRLEDADQVSREDVVKFGPNPPV